MIIVEDVVVEKLRERLTERDVVVEEVWDYIALQHKPSPGMEQQVIADFVTQQDIQNFWWVHDWWAPVPDKPNTLPTPAIIQFCWFVNHKVGTPSVSFNQALQQFYERAVAHCQANKIDTVQPGESAEERRKRRNRERMARVRRGIAVPEKALEGNVVLSAQVRSMEDQIKALKDESKVADQWHAEQVKVHQMAMIEASSHRKATAQDFKTRIEQLRTEIANLIAKQ